MRGGDEGRVGLMGAGTSNWLRGRFYNVEMQRETPERQGLRNLQLDMTGGFAKRFAPGGTLDPVATLSVAPRINRLSMSPPGCSL
jgi:hypothetical protein